MLWSNCLCLFLLTVWCSKPIDLDFLNFELRDIQSILGPQIQVYIVGALFSCLPCSLGRHWQISVWSFALDAGYLLCLCQNISSQTTAQSQYCLLAGYAFNAWSNQCEIHQIKVLGYLNLGSHMLIQTQGLRIQYISSYNPPSSHVFRLDHQQLHVLAFYYKLNNQS